MPGRAPRVRRILTIGLLWGLSLTATSMLFAGELIAEELGVSVPPGFQVKLFADDELAHDIFSLTVDAAGRVVVSGPGYVRILIDEDGDGKADKARQFADGPQSGAQGLYFLGPDLLCTGDEGLILYRDRNRDDRADGPPEVFLKLKTGSEHHAHAIRKGPDGWWYVLVGNMTEVNSGYATLATSPIKHPEAGVLLRLTPDLAGGEIVAHGFRNAYDFDLNAQGEIYTFDSDDERDVSLPWYRPTRVFHVLPASHAGWFSKSWKRPDYFYDMPPVLAAFGRGSPTGVACYRHTQFPAEYHGALFVLDWTFGRIWALPMQRDGEKWKSTPIDFMKGEGEYGFAPTDAEIGPDGSLYVSVGGRGTRGGVFRVTYAPEGIPAQPKVLASGKTPEDKLLQCLEAPQPLSSWSRVKWEPLARELGAAAFVAAALDETRDAAARVRAVEILTELFEGLAPDIAAKLALATAPEVRARTAWSLERKPTKRPLVSVFTGFLSDADPLVRRCALETLALRPELAGDEVPVAALLSCLSDDKPFVRTAATRATAAMDGAAFKALGEEVRKGNWRSALSYAEAFRQRSTFAVPALNAYAIAIGQKILQDPHSLDLKLDACRLVELGLGDLGSTGRLPAAFDGYSSPLDLTKYDRDLDAVRQTIAKLFPTGQTDLDVELTRLAAVLQISDAQLLDKILRKIEPASDAIEDIHYLFVASRLPAARTAKQRTLTAVALLAIESKFTDRKLPQDTNWDARIIELYEQLATADPQMPSELVRLPKFGRPGHINFLGRVPNEQLPDAVATFVKAIDSEPDYPWNNDVVFLLGSVESEPNRQRIRDQYGRLAVRNSLLMTLARQPAEIDRPKFVEGLDAAQPEVLTACLDALLQLPPTRSPRELAMLVRTLRRLGQDKAEFPLRDKVAQLLQRATGKTLHYVSGSAGQHPQPDAIQAWTDWCIATHSQAAAELLGGSESELADIRQLLAAAPWEAGDAERGRKLFEARGCVQCHGGSRGLGPDLSGVAGRFSREDLFIAIGLPSRDVSPRYQTTLIEGKNGKVYSGLIIYESVDGVTLRNSTNQTFRLEADEIEARRQLNVSLMPGGLLKDLSGPDAADLYRYLQSLTARTAARAEPVKLD